MTREEIKKQFSMGDILLRYYLQPNRSGFISCPFHKEKTGSMKIYKDSYYCFGCGAHGDIFTFVQTFEGISFKEVFQSLGGIYENTSFRSRLAVYQAKKRQAMKRHQNTREREERNKNNLLIGAFRWGIRINEPLSDAWCDNYHKRKAEIYETDIKKSKTVEIIFPYGDYQYYKTGLYEMCICIRKYYI